MSRLNIHFEDLAEAGFRRSGNWWIKGNISVNLFTKSIMHGHDPHFTIEFENNKRLKEDVTLKDVMELSRTIGKMTGY